MRKSSGELGQGSECACDPQPVLCGARTITEHALHVIERRHHTERLPDLERLRLT